MADRLYFRQLLSGRDFAVGDPVAAQMVNFVYAIGDRATGECVLVDPAYAVDDLVDAVEADGMVVGGVLATHYHPDHVGGSMMGLHDRGRRRPARAGQLPGARAARRGAVGRPHDRRRRVRARRPRPRRPRHRRRPSRSSSCTRRATRPGSQCFLVEGRLVSGDTLFLDGLRAHRPARQRPGADVRQPAAAGHAAGGHDRVPRPPLLDAVERLDGGDPRAELRLPPVHQGPVDDDVRRADRVAQELRSPPTSAEMPATVSRVSTRRRKRRASRWRRRAMPAAAPSPRPGRATAMARTMSRSISPGGGEDDDADDVEDGEDRRDRRPEAPLVEVPGLQHEHERRAVDAGRHRQRTGQRAAGDVEARARRGAGRGPWR